MSRQKFVNLDNARNDHQRQVMEDISHHGECPFCPENLHKYHNQQILRRGKHWILTPNQWPYDNTQLHLLAIAAQHVITLSELDSGAGEELLGHFKWAEKKYSIKAGGLTMRFGDISNTGATVYHLHGHLIVPNQNLGRDQKVRFKIG